MKIAAAKNIALAITFAFALQCAAQKPNKNFKIVGYLMIGRNNSLAKAARLNFSALTHLNLAFINPDSTGNFKQNDALLQITQLAHKNNVKVLMSFGGGDTQPYLTTFLADDKRPAFIQQLMAILTKNDFDGIDVDLEGDAVDKNYSKFVTELSAKLKAKHKLMTAAVGTWYGKGVTDSALAKFDFVNIMSYDKTGPWEPGKPGQHSPYNMALADIAYWHGARGVAGNKLTLGVPFYGYGFGANNTTSDLNYRTLVNDYPGAETKDSLLLTNGQTGYYNGIPTIKAKTRLAMQQLGGVMIWELSQDATGDLSLLKTIRDVEDGK